MKYKTFLTNEQLNKLEEIYDDKLPYDFAGYIEEKDLDLFLDLLKDSMYLTLYQEFSEQYKQSEKDQMKKDLQELLIPVYKSIANMTINHKIETLMDLLVPSDLDQFYSKLHITGNCSEKSEDEIKKEQERDLLSFKKDKIAKEMDKGLVERIQKLAELGARDAEI